MTTPLDFFSGEQAPLVRLTRDSRVIEVLGLTGSIGLSITPALTGDGRLEVVPTNIGTTYNNLVLTATSDWMDCRDARRGSFGFTLASANTPTDIVFRLEFARSTVGAAYRYTQGDWAALYFEDTETTGAGISRVYPFEVVGDQVRILVVATGTTAANTFTVSNPVVMLWT